MNIAWWMQLSCGVQLAGDERDNLFISTDGITWEVASEFLIPDRRRGKLRIPSHLVITASIWPALEALRFVPLRVELMAYDDVFELIGISPLFDEAKLGQLVPEYIIIVSDGTFRLEKIDHQPGL